MRPTKIFAAKLCSCIINNVKVYTTNNTLLCHSVSAEELLPLPFSSFAPSLLPPTEYSSCRLTLLTTFASYIQPPEMYIYIVYAV